MRKPDYRKEFSAAMRRNILEVRSLLTNKDKGLALKVKNWAARYGHDAPSVERKIRADAMFAAVFAKDPGKQKIHENTAAKFIKSLKGVSNFKQLGHGALVVSQGAIMTPRQLAAHGGASRAKTIDFEWDSYGKKIYASHKYTFESGGAQDNQYKDLQEFIRQASDSQKEKTLFLAIADGEYYAHANKQGRSRMQSLRNLANNRNVFALTSEELPAFLKTLSR